MPIRQQLCVISDTAEVPENNKHCASLLIVDFPTLIPPQNSMASLQAIQVNLLTLTSKAIVGSGASGTRPHPQQVVTQSCQITKFTSPISTLKGHFNIPSTTWLASKPPKNPALYGETHQQQFFRLSFPSPQRGCTGDMPWPRLDVREEET